VRRPIPLAHSYEKAERQGYNIAVWFALQSVPRAQLFHPMHQIVDYNAVAHARRPRRLAANNPALRRLSMKA
jgi:hypothetical protein